MYLIPFWIGLQLADNLACNCANFIVVPNCLAHYKITMRKSEKRWTSMNTNKTVNNFYLAHLKTLIISSDFVLVIRKRRVRGGWEGLLRRWAPIFVRGAMKTQWWRVSCFAHLCFVLYIYFWISCDATAVWPTMYRTAYLLYERSGQATVRCRAMSSLVKLCVAPMRIQITPRVYLMANFDQHCSHYIRRI